MSTPSNPDNDIAPEDIAPAGTAAADVDDTGHLGEPEQQASGRTPSTPDSDPDPGGDATLD